MRRFELTERDLGPGCREIQVSGELDLAVTDRLEQALDRAVSECAQILIGLESCDFIDSTGIAVIVQAHNRMAEQGKRLTVYGASSQVLRILSITGLTSNGLVFEKVEDALSAAGESV